MEGTKYDDGKVPFDLWSPDAIEETSKVLAFGAAKYEPYNWAKGITYRRVFAALLRHLWAWWRGEDLDKETGLHHLAHAMCCLMFLLHYVLNEQYRRFDDRPNYQGIATSGNTSEELCGSRGLDREDSSTVVTLVTDPSQVSGERESWADPSGAYIPDPRD